MFSLLGIWALEFCYRYFELLRVTLIYTTLRLSSIVKYYTVSKTETPRTAHNSSKNIIIAGRESTNQQLPSTTVVVSAVSPA